MKAEQIKKITTAGENYSKQTAYSDDHPQCCTYLRLRETAKKQVVLIGEGGR